MANCSRRPHPRAHEDTATSPAAQGPWSVGPGPLGVVQKGPANQRGGAWSRGHRPQTDFSAFRFAAPRNAAKGPRLPPPCNGLIARAAGTAGFLFGPSSPGAAPWETRRGVRGLQPKERKASAEPGRGRGRGRGLQAACAPRASAGTPAPRGCPRSVWSRSARAWDPRALGVLCPGWVNKRPWGLRIPWLPAFSILSPCTPSTENLA